MRRLFLGALVFLAVVSVFPGVSWSGGPGTMRPAPLDPVLMGFKEQGVWYFLCTAPEYCYRIPPHFQTYGPPPPPCCPVPLIPVPPPRKVH